MAYSFNKRPVEDAVWNYRRLISSSQSKYFEYSGFDKLKEQIKTFLGSEDDSVFLDDQRLRAYAEMLWNANKGHCHENCKDHFLEYCDMPYANYKGTGTCLVCSRPVSCAEGMEHEYVALTWQECHTKKIPHYGNCYTVSECKNCGNIHAVDSSG